MARKVNITLPSYPSLEIRMEGDWQKVQSLTEGISQSLKKGYDKGTIKIATSIIRIVKRSISSGQPPMSGGVNWAPLSESTIKRYGVHSVYYLTGQYYRAISIYKYKSRVLVGFPIGIKHSGSSLTLNQIALILENGNENIPARPLWKPSLKSYGGLKKIKKELITSIRKQLMNDHGLHQSQIKVTSW